MVDDGAGRADAVDAAALATDVNFLLARANALSLAAGAEALAPHGLRVRSYSVLALAASAGPTQREMAETLRLDPSQIVALVDELEERGLVERRPDPADRRTRAVVATAAGRELFAAAERSALESQLAVTSGLSEPEREQFARLLRRIALG